MEIRASVHNQRATHRAVVSTDGRESTLKILPKPGGTGSSINGGELLCLALATCYCNDLYREAARRGVPVDAVEVEVVSEFGAAGEPARRITYTARVESPAPAAEIAALLRHTDTVAEVQNTLRAGITVEFRAAADRSVPA
jgi:uncharacterized OsmC-like protein